MVGQNLGNLTVIKELFPMFEIQNGKRPRIVLRRPWLCKCTCGTERIIFGHHFNRFDSCVACAIKKANLQPRARPKRPSGNRLRSTPGEQGFKQLFSTYKIHARQRAYEWGLNAEEFRTLTQGDCHYCGIKPIQSVSFSKKLAPNTRTNNEYLYNGVDRKINSIGYIFSNCVSCCGRCNKMKNTLDDKAFLKLIITIACRFESELFNEFKISKHKSVGVFT